MPRIFKDVPKNAFFYGFLKPFPPRLFMVVTSLEAVRSNKKQLVLQE